MLDVVAGTLSLVKRRGATVVDLGIGTGALATRCLTALPSATLHGIDADPDILRSARRRLARHGARLRLIQGNFLRTSLPPCHAIVATLALHHILSLEAKERFYRACRAALRRGRGGLLVNGDVYLSDHLDLTREYMDRWQRHLRRYYSARQARAFFRAWASEDRYFPLTKELAALKAAGFDTEVVWRRPPFGVVLARPRG